AKQYAGYSSFLFPEKRGLWAGIYWQTRWQEQSARHDIGLWSIVNATLTIEPFYFARDFESQVACEDSRLFDAFPTSKSESKIATCKLWHKYFSASKQSSILTQTRNQRFLWAAHTAAISDILHAHSSEFD